MSKRAIGVIFVGALWSVASTQAHADALIKGALAYYADQREYNTASISVASTRPLLGFSLWGFSDLHGDQHGPAKNLSRSFSEYRLSHNSLSKLVPGLGLQAEANFLTPTNTLVSRYGLTYRHTLPLPLSTNGWLQWRAFPVESDGDGGQLSLIYFLPLHDRVHLKGFADYNYSHGGRASWVIEPELNFKVADGAWVLLEWRYNDFERRSTGLEGEGFALGLRYEF